MRGTVLEVVKILVLAVVPDVAVHAVAAVVVVAVVAVVLPHVQLDVLHVMPAVAHAEAHVKDLVEVVVGVYVLKTLQAINKLCQYQTYSE